MNCQSQATNHFYMLMSLWLTNCEPLMFEAWCFANCCTLRVNVWVSGPDRWCRRKLWAPQFIHWSEDSLGRKAVSLNHRNHLNASKWIWIWMKWNFQFEWTSEVISLESLWRSGHERRTFRGTHLESATYPNTQQAPSRGPELWLSPSNIRNCALQTELKQKSHWSSKRLKTELNFRCSEDSQRRPSSFDFASFLKISLLFHSSLPNRTMLWSSQSCFKMVSRS